MKKSLIFFGLLILALCACEKEIEYQGEGKEPLLVLDAVLEINVPPSIRLTRSVFFLSNNQSSADVGINGATVKLTDITNGIEYVLTSGSSSGYYQGSVSIKPNTRYKIEISHPKYTAISSEMTTVSQINLSDLDTSSVLDNFTTRYFLKLKFQDPNESNFYGVSVFSKRKITYYDFDSTILQIDSSTMVEYLESKDPSMAFQRSGGIFFDDAYFNGSFKTYGVEVGVYSYNFNQEVEILSWTATLTNLSEGAFKYFKSIGNNQPNGPFNDPSNVYTNVKNGLGIFGSYSRSFLEK